jgi:arsenate reductase
MQRLAGGKAAAGDEKKRARPHGPVTIFHNPRCQSSRRALALLEEAGADVVVVEYLKTPPSALELAEIARKVGVHPRELIRTKEPEFQALGRPLEDLGAAAAIAAIAEHPILLQRPILVRDERAVVARPPERVDEILGPPAPVIPLRRPRQLTSVRGGKAGTSGKAATKRSTASAKAPARTAAKPGAAKRAAKKLRGER